MKEIIILIAGRVDGERVTISPGREWLVLPPKQETVVSWKTNRNRWRKARFRR